MIWNQVLQRYFKLFYTFSSFFYNDYDIELEFSNRYKMTFFRTFWPFWFWNCWIDVQITLKISHKECFLWWPIDLIWRFVQPKTMEIRSQKLFCNFLRKTSDVEVSFESKRKNRVGYMKERNQKKIKIKNYIRIKKGEEFLI
jgi:hypothetical protein